MKSYKTLMLGSVATSALLLGAVSTPVLAQNVDVGHKGGAFYLKTKDGKFSVLPSAQIQVRYTYVNVDSGSGDDDISEVTARRVRFGVGGRAGSKNLTYKITFDISTNSSSQEDGDAGTGIFDSYLNYKFNNALQLRAGIWKQKFTEGHSASTSKNQFVDRTDGDSAVRADRDTGIGISGKLFKMLSYEAAVIGGNTRKSPDDNLNHSFTASLRLEPFGKYGTLYEGDIKNSKKLKLQLSAGGIIKNDVTFSTRGNKNTFISLAGAADVYGWTTGAGVKWRGFSLAGEYSIIKMQDASGNKGAEGPNAGTKVAGETIKAWNLQASYFVLPKKWSIAGRWEYRNLNSNAKNHRSSGATIANARTSSDALVSYGLGTSYFIRGQAHKIQADWLRFNDVDGGGDNSDSGSHNNQFRVQWQVRF